MTKALIPAENQPSEIKTFEANLFGEDQRSVINLVPELVKVAMLSVPNELVGMDEHKLKLKIKPNITCSRLRISFWNEYNRAQETGEKMDITLVYAGICSRQYFYDQLLKVPVLMSWIICPPAEYMKAMNETLYEGIQQLREIIGMPLKTKGKYDMRIVDRVLKAFVIVDQRVRGAIVQKTEIKAAHLHVDVEPTVGLTNDDDMAEIKRRIKQIEKENRKLHAARNIESTAEAILDEQINNSLSAAKEKISDYAEGEEG